MARPPFWLPRQHQIRQAVAGPVRSHYDRRDLEGLFELQPRGAGNHTAIVENKRLGHALAIVKAQQDRQFASEGHDQQREDRL